MKRLLLAFLFGWLVLVPAARVRAQEEVEYLDPATHKKTTLRGTIQSEGPGGIQFKTRSGVVNVSSLDIQYVFYKTKINPLDYHKPFIKLDNAAKARSPQVRQEYLDDALSAFRKLDADLVAEGQANGHRYIQYRIATTLVQQAEADPGTPARMDAALEALGAYKKEFPDGWEVVPALQLLARLREQKGDVAAARKAYEELGEVPGLPRAIKQESDLLVARLYLRSNQPADAEKRLAALRTKMSDNDPQRPELDVLLAESFLGQKKLDPAEESLKAALASATDARLKARAYNYLGDYYRLKQKPEDAFWQYLRVEVVYNQDREEEAKALFYLRTLYDSVLNDRARAEQCADKLKGKKFKDTRYQKETLEGKK